MPRTVRSVLGSLFLVLAISGYASYAVRAQTATDLQSQIQASNKQIEQLRAEIAQLQTELNTTAKQKQTLQSAIQEINLNIQKLTKSITLTQAEIKQKDTEIGSLSGSIDTTVGRIGRSQEQVGNSLRLLDIADTESQFLMLLGVGTLSSFFDEAAELAALRIELQNNIRALSHLKEGYETDKSAAEKKRKELASLQAQLNDQKQGLAISRDAQNKLLADTKNKESTYQAQIAQKKALEAKFEQDLANFENQLNLIVNPGSFAAPAPGILSWPVAQPRVTQYFGNTDFATQNPQIYSGKGHNAIDLRATTGTPIRAARGGVVRGTGNTDLTCPGASYGKWVFVDHDNGLSTLYSHFSVINVSEGQLVTPEQVLGYAGSTGYATGPHLHFGVYATAGSKIASFPSKSCAGKTYTMPVADPSAYLNPLSYLPAL